MRVASTQGEADVNTRDKTRLSLHHRSGLEEVPNRHDENKGRASTEQG